MCGIIGYVGNDEKAVEVILDGLSKLEYRGYDSAGLAIIEKGHLFVEKKSGKLDNLKNSLKDAGHYSNVGIGHTRWATHGVPTDVNSHPHCSCDKKVAVVHNGIIENYATLKDELIEKGYAFSSDTDSEVAAQLFSYLYTGDLLETIMKVRDKIRGSYALGIIHEEQPDKIICTRKESPLIIGLGKDKNFIASDVPAILKYTRDVIFLENDEIAIIEEGKVTVFNEEGKPIVKEISKIEWDMEQASKNGYPHFMLKEIEEQPAVVERTLEVYIKPDGKIDFGKVFEKIDFEKIKEIDIIACGTAYHAGLQAAYFFKKMAKIKTNVDIASEFRYSDPFLNEDNLVIFISQSGETLDTLMALKLARSKGAKTLAITNVVGSTISREADVVLYTVAGPEISVASTKAYTTQVVTFYLLALYVAFKCKRVTLEEYDSYLDKIYSLSEKITREGSLKMKEITYIHTEAFPAGELKHGPIALIEEGTMIVVVSTQRDMVEKVASNIKELKARGAFVISVTKADYKEILDVSDRVILIDDIDDMVAPLLSMIPLQLLSYYTAVAKGLDVDKPRNLAKSVTVE